MKILVTVKRVIDYNVQVRVKGDGSGVEKDTSYRPVGRYQILSGHALNGTTTILLLMALNIG